MIFTEEGFALGIYLTGCLWYAKELIFGEEAIVAFVVIILGFVFMQVIKLKNKKSLSEAKQDG